jgi:hypothetical protein
MRVIKEMLSACVKDNQQDWNEHLQVIAQMYNSTINSATGMIPYYLVHGTEMNGTDQDHVEGLEVDDFHAAVRRIKDIQQWCWVYAGTRGERNQEGYNRVPAERLEFVPYEPGDFFFNRVVPKRAPKSKKDEMRIILSEKLQFRYAGPYIIKEVLLPILYRAIIHGKERVVHALNIKPVNKKRKFIKRTVNLQRKTAKSPFKPHSQAQRTRIQATSSEEFSNTTPHG